MPRGRLGFPHHWVSGVRIASGLAELGILAGRRLLGRCYPIHCRHRWSSVRGVLFTSCTCSLADKGHVFNFCAFVFSQKFEAVQILQCIVMFFLSPMFLKISIWFIRFITFHLGFPELMIFFFLLLLILTESRFHSFSILLFLFSFLLLYF